MEGSLNSLPVKRNLAIGLIAVLVLQPFMIGSSLLITDIIIVAVMSLVSIVPFGLYLRGVIYQQR